MRTRAERTAAVRRRIAPLTLRGRAFVAAGVTALACALLLGQTALARIGVLVLVLPLLAVALVVRRRDRLTLTRTVSPPVVTAGQPATVRLSLRNDSRRGTGLLLLEEQLPYQLGTRPRFVLDRLGGGRRREVSYRVRSEVRGHFPIGPMTVRVSDPFGLVEQQRTFHTVRPLVVVPPTVPLPNVPLDGSWSGSGENRPQAFATGSAEDVTVREYRTGDDLRRVHWRSSARAGELMVRREEQPWQSRATVFLDNRAAAHRGTGSGSSLETAVSVAASVVEHLGARGYGVRLVTTDGVEGGAGWHDRAPAASSALLLEALASVAAVDAPVLGGAGLEGAGHTGLLVAVLGALEEADVPVLRRMQHQAAGGVAVVLDVDGWSPQRTSRPGHGAALLAGLGWRSASLPPNGSLARSWQELGRNGRGAAAVEAAR